MQIRVILCAVFSHVVQIWLSVNNMSFTDFLSSQEKAKYLFSFNFVALSFVLPQLEQVSLFTCSDYIVHF